VCSKIFSELSTTGKIRDADREKHRCYCLSIDIALLGIILTQTNQLTRAGNSTGSYFLKPETPSMRIMENRLKVNVIVNAPDNPIFLLTVSEHYTSLGFQPAEGDLLTILPENAGDIESVEVEFQKNSTTLCLLEVYKCELNPDLNQLDVFCSLKK
jgi:hypothetical protein